MQAEGWLGDLLAGTAERTLTPVEPPAGSPRELRPYQQRGVAWLAFLASLGLGACLADDMGLGKTVQLLALEAARAGARGRAGPTLLLCPMSMVGTWEREAARFAPTCGCGSTTAPPARGDDLRDALGAPTSLVTTYATAARDADDLAEVDWHRLVLDEAQEMKNARRGPPAPSAGSGPGTASRSPAPRWRTASPSSGRSWTCSTPASSAPPSGSDALRGPDRAHGTPTPRSCCAAHPALPAAPGQDRPDDRRRPARQDRDHAALPADPRAGLALPHDRRRHAGEDRRRDGIARRGNVLAAMTKLKQVCNHPAQLLHDGSPIGRRSGKVVRLEEILAEVLAEGDRALCFTQFTEFGHLLVPHLPPGSTPRSRSCTAAPPAAARGDGPALPGGDGAAGPAASLKAGGTGLTLTAAQPRRAPRPLVEPGRRGPGHRPRLPHRAAPDRAGRTSSSAPAPWRSASTADRVEARARPKLVVGDGEGWLTELSTATLRELFALGARREDDEGGVDGAEPVRAAG